MLASSSPKRINSTVDAKWPGKDLSATKHHCRYTITPRSSDLILQYSGKYDSKFAAPIPSLSDRSDLRLMNQAMDNSFKLDRGMGEAITGPAIENYWSSSEIPDASCMPSDRSINTMKSDSDSTRSRYPPTSWRDSYNPKSTNRQNHANRKYSRSAHHLYRISASEKWVPNRTDIFEVKNKMPDPSLKSTEMFQQHEPQNNEVIKSPDAGKTENVPFVQAISSRQCDHQQTELSFSFSASYSKISRDASNPIGMKALSSIPDAATPFSSPLTSPLFIQLQTHEKHDASLATQTHTKSASPILDRFISLPSPESAYSQVSYYTECPHYSPPLPRPLNVQPNMVSLFDIRSKFQQILDHLDDTSTDTGENQEALLQQISVLDGSCPNCDFLSRRQQETDVLSKYHLSLNEMASRPQLRGLESVHIYDAWKFDKKIDSGQSITTLERDAISEDTLAKILNQRDYEVQNVWRGFTQRWGPGTVGIHRSSLKNSGHSAPSTSHISSSAEGEPIDSDCSDCSTSGNSSSTSSRGRKTISDSASAACRPSRSLSTSTGRCINIRGNNSLDEIIDEGRMRIEWIRPDRYT